MKIIPLLLLTVIYIATTACLSSARTLEQLTKECQQDVPVLGRKEHKSKPFQVCIWHQLKQVPRVDGPLDWDRRQSQEGLGYPQHKASNFYKEAQQLIGQIVALSIFLSRTGVVVCHYLRP